MRFGFSSSLGLFFCVLYSPNAATVVVVRLVVVVVVVVLIVDSIVIFSFFTSLLFSMNFTKDCVVLCVLQDLHHDLAIYGCMLMVKKDI